MPTDTGLSTIIKLHCYLGCKNLLAFLDQRSPSTSSNFLGLGLKLWAEYIRVIYWSLWTGEVAMNSRGGESDKDITKH